MDPHFTESSTAVVIATTITVATVSAVLWLNRQQSRFIQKILYWVPAILFIYLIPASITHAASLDLSKVYLHALSRNWIIPLTVVTVMSALSIVHLRQVGSKPIILFVSGSLVIATLPVVLVWIGSGLSHDTKTLFVAEQYWRGLVPIVGSWIGGSTSQLVLRELADCPETLFLSVVVLDNLLVNIWTILMFQAIKRSDAFNSIFKVQASMPEPLKLSQPSHAGFNSKLIAAASLLLSTALVNWFTEEFLIRIVLLSVTGLLLGNIVRRWDHAFVIKCGSILILVIMAILGLRLDFAGLSLPLTFVVICIVWIVAHYLIMLIIARIMRLNMAWVPIASMANLGGISTAPAVTAAYNKDWMPHAILLAILSMVTGNFWGIYSMYLFEYFVR